MALANTLLQRPGNRVPRRPPERILPEFRMIQEALAGAEFIQSKRVGSRKRHLRSSKVGSMKSRFDLHQSVVLELSQTRSRREGVVSERAHEVVQS